MPGFRPGKVPVKLLESRIDKQAMLDQVVGEAVPGRYSEAVASSDVQPLGQPEIEVTNKEYGEDLTFTAEVDVRPEIELPDLAALTITVDPIEVTDDEVDTELQNLRARFGTLTGVDRAGAGRRLRLDRPVGHRRRRGRARGQDRGPVPRGRLGSAHRGSRRRHQGPQGRREQGVHHQAGRRRARRPGRRGHRHGQVGQGARAARARRRVRPTGKRIRHHRRAQGEPRRAGASGSSASAGRADPRQGARDAARAGRGAAARGHRAGAGRRHPAQRDPRPRPRRGQVRRGAGEGGQHPRGVRRRQPVQRREGRQDPAADGRRSPTSSTSRSARTTSPSAWC